MSTTPTESRGPRRHHQLSGVGAVLATSLAVVAALAACTSSSTPGPSSTAATAPTGASSAPSTSVASTPTDTGPTLVQLPLPASTATTSRVTKPAGLPQIPGRVCSAGDDAVALYLKVSVFSATTPLEQTSNFKAAGQLASRQIPMIRSTRAKFIAAGYPATFPLVRDMDRELAALTKLVSIAKAGDLKALPAVYSELLAAGDQYANDASDDICK